MFNKSLSLYNAEYLERFQELLGHGATAVEKLRYWQRHLLASHGKRNIGCMIVNSALELADPEFGVFKAEFDHMSQRMRQMLEPVISHDHRDTGHGAFGCIHGTPSKSIGYGSGTNDHLKYLIG